MVPSVDQSQSTFSPEHIQEKVFDNARKLNLLAKKIDKEISLIKKRIIFLEIRLRNEFQNIKNGFLQCKIDKIEDKLQIKQLQIQNLLYLQKIENLCRRFCTIERNLEFLKTHRHDFAYLIIHSNDVSARYGTTFIPKLA